MRAKTAETPRRTPPPTPRLRGDRTSTELTYSGIRIDREPWIDLETSKVVETTPRVLLVLSTNGGTIREAELDAVDLAKLIAEAAAANLILSNERSDRR